jgi:hypothetical protein
MKSKGSAILLDTEGKGFLGCLIALILLTAILFAGIKLGPVYYSNYIFEEDIKTATSRAGANAIRDETLVKDILALAKKNQITISRKNIEIKRYAGQVHVVIRYSVDVDLMIVQKTFEFQVGASSFTVG